MALFFPVAPKYGRARAARMPGRSPVKRAIGVRLRESRRTGNLLFLRRSSSPARICDRSIPAAGGLTSNPKFGMFG